MLETAARNSFDIGGHGPGLCDCILCRSEQPFDMPEQLLTACREGGLVIFAGSGISTERPTVLPVTLYDHVRAELALDDSENVSFPELMSKFEAARGRIALLEAIKERFDYVKSFPNIDNQASEFHRELAALFTVRDIVTTNWDDYFERFCDAQPFVTDEDWAFWKTRDRKIFKLHGSIMNPGSIVATEADYGRCYRKLNQGLVGAKLKEMLATKTVVFVGYSLRDGDFVRLYRLMKRQMGGLLPRSYVVTVSDEEPADVAKGMHFIRTSGVHFIRELKSQFGDNELVRDDRFDVLPLMRAYVRKIHHELIERGEMRDDPAMLMCACYHDGLMDAFDHIMANAPKGDYYHRCYTEGLVSGTYAILLREREKDGRWLSVPYIEGYMNGLSFLIADDDSRKELPFYYVAGAKNDLKTYHEYAEVAPYFATLNRKAHDYAKRQAQRLAPGVVFQHLPALL